MSDTPVKFELKVKVQRNKLNLKTIFLSGAVVAIFTNYKLPTTGTEETGFRESKLETYENPAMNVNLEIVKDQDVPITPSEIGRFCTI